MVLEPIILLDTICGNKRRGIMEEDDALLGGLGEGVDAHCN